MPVIMTKILSIIFSVVRPWPSNIGINRTIYLLRSRNSQLKMLFHPRNQLVYSQSAQSLSMSIPDCLSKNFLNSPEQMERKMQVKPDSIIIGLEAYRRNCVTPKSLTGRSVSGHIPYTELWRLVKVTHFIQQYQMSAFICNLYASITVLKIM